jgi:hypothetical protein
MFPANLGTSWVRLKIGIEPATFFRFHCFRSLARAEAILAEVMAHEVHHQVA